MKNILVPIDFSVYSINAARTAAAIATLTGSRLYLLHLADIPIGWNDLTLVQQQAFPQLEKTSAKANLNLDKFKKQAFLKDCNVEAYVLGGVPFEQINIFAKRNSVSLIVMGVHGAGESNSQFIGSTAQRVLRTAPCPVLGVKKHFNLGKVNKILFASDFADDVSAPLTTVKELATSFGANVDLAYINTPGHFVDDATMEGRMKPYDLGNKKVKFSPVIYNSTEKAEGIVDCAARRNADLIAMVTRFKNNKPSYQISVTESVLFHSTLPVLSFVGEQSRR